MQCTVVRTGEHHATCHRRLDAELHTRRRRPRPPSCGPVQRHQSTVSRRDEHRAIGHRRRRADRRSHRRRPLDGTRRRIERIHRPRVRPHVQRLTQHRRHRRGPIQWRAPVGASEGPGRRRAGRRPAHREGPDAVAVRQWTTRLEQSPVARLEGEVRAKGEWRRDGLAPQGSDDADRPGARMALTRFGEKRLELRRCSRR